MLNFSRMCLPIFAKPVLYEVPTYLAQNLNWNTKQKNKNKKKRWQILN